MAFAADELVISGKAPQAIVAASAVQRIIALTTVDIFCDIVLAFKGQRFIAQVDGAVCIDMDREYSPCCGVDGSGTAFCIIKSDCQITFKPLTIKQEIF